MERTNAGTFLGIAIGLAAGLGSYSFTYGRGASYLTHKPDKLSSREEKLSEANTPSVVLRKASLLQFPQQRRQVTHHSSYTRVTHLLHCMTRRYQLSPYHR